MGNQRGEDRLLKGLKIGLCALLMISLSCNEKEQVQSPLVGLWKLESMKVRNTATNTWSHYRGGMDGYLLYDANGHVSLHLFDRGYENAAMTFPNFNDCIPLEALKYITKSYYYMGNYKISGEDSIVSHTKVSHSNPSEFGLTAERRFYFNGDTLVMQPIERKNVNLKLKWLRQH